MKLEIVLFGGGLAEVLYLRPVTQRTFTDRGIKTMDRLILARRCLRLAAVALLLAISSAQPADAMGDWCALGNDDEACLSIDYLKPNYVCQTMGAGCQTCIEDPGEVCKLYDAEGVNVIRTAGGYSNHQET